MAKKRGKAGSGAGENLVDEVGTEAWNVADGYTKLKILRNMILLDKYDTMSLYGTWDIEESDEVKELSANERNKRRLEGLNRFKTTLRQLLGNVQFALMQKPKIRKLIHFYFQRLDNIDNYLPYVSEWKENYVTHEDVLEINEKMFKLVHSILQNIKDEINIPINQAGLIFRESDELDLDKIQKEIMEGG